MGMSRPAAADPDALYTQARHRLHGIGCPRDAAAAYALYRKAAGKGHIAAARARAHLTASGTGCRADPEEARRLLGKIAGRDPYAAAQLDLLKRVPEPGRPRRDVVSVSPEIVLVGGLLAAEECRWIIDRALPAIAPSFVIDPVDGGRMPHPFRTSHGTNFSPLEEDLVLGRINRRVAAATGTRTDQGEPLHVLRYTPGQEYRPHLDTIPGAANQRVWTALLYLNAGYQGGESDFPDLGITIAGAPGDAILFRSLDDQGRPDPRTRHAGLPVTEGVKWLATRWIREERHDPFEGAPG